MELNDYQDGAMSTCMDSCHNWEYMFTGLVGEVGELASKVAKAVRKKQITILGNRIGNYQMSADEYIAFMDGLASELGDVLWFVAGLADTMQWELEYIAHTNLSKLKSRKKRGVIDGNGDNR